MRPLLALVSVCAIAACPGGQVGRMRVLSDTFSAPAALLRVSWSRPLLTKPRLLLYKPQEFAAAAVSDDGVVFVGSSARTLYAFRERDGEVLWTHDLSGGVASEPLYLRAGLAASQAAVILGDDDGALTALGASSGKVLWTYRVRGAIRTTPSYAEGLIYFASGEGRLYAVDARTGAWRWQYERDVPESFTIRGASGALAHGGRVYAGFPDGYLVALNAATGEAAWLRQLSGDASRFTDVDSTPVLSADGTLYASSYSGGVYALDPRDGSTRWRFEMEGAGPLALDGRGRVYVSASTGIHCLDEQGRLVWRQSMAKQGELSVPTLWGPYLLISAAASGTYIVDAESGLLLQYFDPGQGVTGRATVHGPHVFLLSNVGVFFALTSG